MTAVVIISLLILLMYAVLTVWMGTRLSLGERPNQYRAPLNFSLDQLTVIIPCRNEAHVVKRLLDQLKGSQATLLVVDDHSTDATVQIVESCGVVVIQNKGRGKKSALQTGLQEVRTSFVLTIDADVILPSSGLDHLPELVRESPADLWLFPVLTKKGRSALARFEALDVLSLNATAAAFAYQNRAIMGSGAFLLIKTEVYKSAIGHLRYDLASGDDVFLIQHLRRTGKKIHMFTQTAAQVEVEAHTSLRSFIRQRIRWGQKSPSYTDILAQAVAWLVMLANFAVLTSLALAILHQNAWLLLVLALKALLDLALLLPAAKVFDRYHDLRFLPLAVLFYPFYLSFAAAWAVLSHPAVRRKENKNWDSQRKFDHRS